MRRLAHIALSIVAVLLISCGNNASQRDTEPIYSPRYAKGFAIERDRATGATLLCSRNPWQGAEGVTLYYDIDTIAPPQRIIAMSSSHTAMLDAVGCAERIVGVSGCRFIYNPTLCRAINEGKIEEVGYDSSFDFEKIRALNADVVLLYGVAGEAKAITDKLDELHIPYIYIGDYLEANPLGKAEWVVALAHLCGVAEQGQTLFAEVERRYNALREQRHCSSYRPRVMLNLPYRDTWFMPPKGSYMVQLIEDAGGEYLYQQNDTSSSKPISLEEALLLAMKADFWLNLGQMASMEEVCAAAPRFAKVDAVRLGRLYNNTKRTTESRGSDFWESGAVRPDIILEDLIKILHYEAPTDSLYYYTKIE